MCAPVYPRGLSYSELVTILRNTGYREIERLEIWLKGKHHYAYVVVCSTKQSVYSVNTNDEQLLKLLKNKTTDEAVNHG